jgi:hypothetical protein
MQHLNNSNADWCRFQKQYFLFSIKEEKQVTPSFALNLLFHSFIIIVHTLFDCLNLHIQKSFVEKLLKWKTLIGSLKEIFYDIEKVKEVELRGRPIDQFTITLDYKMNIYSKQNFRFSDIEFMCKEIR